VSSDIFDCGDELIVIGNCGHVSLSAEDTEFVIFVESGGLKPLQGCFG
jgi:hypothetical protein